MKQGEIWRISLDPTVGAEMRKTRPVLILNTDALGKLPLRVIVPITDWKEGYADYPWMVKIEPSIENGLTKDSTADCFQLRCVSEQRFTARLGAVPPEIILRTQEAVFTVIGAMQRGIPHI
jgi:mRNA interferase MazF